jgi:CelD/BcsL family acetyltransferase involved in cellulose biosynthesis
MRVQFLDDLTAADPIADEWAKLAECAGVGIYLTSDWCQVYWRHYGAGRRLQIVRLDDGSRLAGVVPFTVDRIRVAGVPFRLGRLLGGDYSPKLLDPPITAEAAADGAEAIAKLVADGRMDLAMVGPMAPDTPFSQALDQMATSGTGSVRVTKTSSPGTVTMIPLATTYDEYLQGLNKDQRAKARYEVRQLEKAYRVGFYQIQEGDIESEFDRFRLMHNAQWDQQQSRGHFRSWPRSYAFNLDLCKAAARRGWLRFSRLDANDAPVAYQYAFRFGRTYHWRLPSRQVSAELRKFSLGRVALLKMMEFAIGEGTAQIEAGMGHYEYKNQLGGREIQTVQYAVRSATARGSLAEKVLRWNSLFLEVLYHKLWYVKLGRQFPWLRRPLWECYIKCKA